MAPRHRNPAVASAAPPFVGMLSCPSGLEKGSGSVTVRRHQRVVIARAPWGQLTLADVTLTRKGAQASKRQGPPPGGPANHVGGEQLS